MAEGAAVYLLTGMLLVQLVGFWLTVSLLTPFILLVGFFSSRRRLLHDMLIGTVVVNHPSRIHPPYDAGP